MKEIEQKNLITNFDKIDLPLYEEAIKEYDHLFIDKNAYDGLGNKDKDLYALRTEDINNLTDDFWNIYNDVYKRNF